MYHGPQLLTTHAESVVYDQRNAVVMCYFRQCCKVGDIVLGVSDTLDVECFGVLVDGCSERGGLICIDEFNADSVFFECH
jgi:hypothetical protein